LLVRVKVGLPPVTYGLAGEALIGRKVPIQTSLAGTVLVASRALVDSAAIETSSSRSNKI
jgi:hypothetical protein